MNTNSLEFILRLQDLFSPKMLSAAGVSESAAGKIKSQFTGIEYSGKQMSASLSDLHSRLDSINQIRFSTTIKKEFDAATAAARVLERQIDKLENTGQKKHGGLIGMLGGVALGAGAFGLGKMSLSQAATREQQNISFEVMTGSKSTGTKMVNDLVTMGAKTPYESADLIKNAQTLKAFGIENEKVLPILNTIGDIAGGSAEKLQSLSLAFAQASSAGKLGGQDLLQMVNAGFNPLQQMVHDKVFPSMKEARKAMEHGSIGTHMMEEAFKSATGPGGQFYQMMDKQSQTLNGRWSTFMDNAKMKLLSLGNAMMPAASWLLDFGSAMLEGEPWAVALAAGIGLLTLSLTWASIQAGIYSAVIKSVTFFTGLWNGAQQLLNAAFWTNPITWVVAGIIALIAIIGYVIYTTDGWGKQWDSIMKFFHFSWAAFGDYFKLAWLDLQDDFMIGIELIEKGWYKLKSLWDSEGASAGLAKINEQQNTRASELAKAKGVLDSDLKNAQNSLTWELHSNGKTLGSMIGDLKKTMGIGAGASHGVVPTIAGTAITKADYGKLSDDGKSKADGINSGGQRSVIINIAKQIEKIENHIVGGGKEVADEIEGAVREAMRRVMYSINAEAS